MARASHRAWIAVLAIAGLASSASALESYALLANGQKIQGSVPAGADIRIEFPLAAGAEPRITFSLVGAKVNQPISFTATQLFGPDGQEILLAPDTFVVKHTPGRDSVSFRGFTSTQSGNHTLFLKTNSRIRTNAHGKLTVVRPTRIPFLGDETSAPLEVPLQPGDQSSVVVRRLSGSPPKVEQYRLPSGASSTPTQEMTKKGSNSRWLFAVQFGVHQYAIGYQADPLEGAWKGFVKIRPFRGNAPVILRLRNSPGIPLTVFDADRLLPLNGVSGVGVSSDGSSVLVTTGTAGTVLGQRYGLDLATLPTVPPVTLGSAGDFSAGEAVGGHRVMRMGSSYFLGVASSSGKELVLARMNGDLSRAAFAQLVTGSADSTADFFLAGDGSNVSVGRLLGSGAHTVHVAPAEDFGARTTTTIGGSSYPQSAGSGAAWRQTDEVYELWSPDTLDYHGPSDLHRVLYNASWTPVTSDAQPVNEPFLAETMPTAVVSDGQSGATIVFYVVPDNPPLDAASTGFGTIHRRIYDSLGVEVPGSHALLPVKPANRPAAVVVGNNLYVGYETPGGAQVERQPILR